MPIDSYVILLFIFAFSLYLNTLSGGYVWDDRAAIIGNADVVGKTSLFEMLGHDFWGQPISAVDSHKSYRPITTLSFRINHYVHGHYAWGYHLGNTMIFATVCIVFYSWTLQWMPSKTGARIAALIFCCHPIHVEAVASIVGRADSLCGLFYVASMVLYTTALRANGEYSVVTYRVKYCVFLIGSYVCALAASLAKEVGVTVLPLLCLLEGAESLRNLEKAKPVEGSRKWTQLTDSRIDMDAHSFKGSESLLLKACWNCLTTGTSCARLLLSLTQMVAITVLRLHINGSSGLYRWTIMENHISLMPSMKDRALSYGQSHFWYFFKLVYPRRLSFDYGYSCIPTVTAISDWRNLLPLLVYTTVVATLLRGIRLTRLPLLVGGACLLLPLVPALNIIFPVGTVLAERLLFVPSLGFCMIVADLLCEDLRPLWKTLASLGLLMWHGEGQSEVAVTQGDDSTRIDAPVKTTEIAAKPVQMSDPNRSMLLGKDGDAEVASLDDLCSSAETSVLFRVVVFPLCVLGAVRIVSRNADWNSELRLYRSALEVCPTSVKALANYATLILSQGDAENAIIAAETAVALMPDHAAAHINVGIAYGRTGQYVKSVLALKEAIRIAPDNGKTYGYLGTSLHNWALTDGVSSAAALALRQEAAAYLDQAILHGFSPPVILHSRGSVALDSNQFEVAVAYLAESLKMCAEAKAVRGYIDLPPSDLVDEQRTYNQLASAYSNLGQLENALAAYQAGLRLDPESIFLHTNIANLYRQLQRDDLARAHMREGIQIAENHGLGQRAPTALLNNLGLLELDHGNAQAAMILFERALNQVVRDSDENKGYETSVSQMRPAGGSGSSSIEEVLMNNINRAYLALGRSREGI